MADDRASEGDPPAAAASPQIVRDGSMLIVTGATATGPDGTLVPGEAYAQARLAIEGLLAALGQAGSSADDVMHVHAHLRDPERDAAAVTLAHGEAFGPSPPALAIAPAAAEALADPRVLVELEALAFTPEP